MSPTHRVVFWAASAAKSPWTSVNLPSPARITVVIERPKNPLKIAERELLDTCWLVVEPGKPFPSAACAAPGGPALPAKYAVPDQPEKPAHQRRPELDAERAAVVSVNPEYQETCQPCDRATEHHGCRFGESARQGGYVPGPPQRGAVAIACHVRQATPNEQRQSGKRDDRQHEDDTVGR